MHQIRWNDRFKGNVYGSSRITVDGTDVRIQEPSKFSPKWFSHKFKGPGLRYEVGVCIGTGSIIWVNGPYPCGSFSAVRIFRKVMKMHLGVGEGVVTVGGYMEEVCIKPGEGGGGFLSSTCST